MITQGLDVPLLVGIGIVVGLLCCVAGGAVWHAATARTLPLVILWIGAGVLLVGSVLGGFSIGFFFLPSAITGVAAAGVGTLGMPQDRKT